MSIRAKFCVASVSGSADGSEITLNPVYTGSAENESFYAATPAGEIRLNVVNPAAAAQFIVGASFYVDFTRAEPEVL